MEKTKINEIVTQAFIARELFGIDPGKSNGGIVKYNDNIYESWPLKKMVDFEYMVDFFKYQSEICKLPLLVIEMINTYNSDSDNLGRMHRLKRLKDHYVELKSAIKLSKIPFIEVQPISWQKYINIYIPDEDYQIRKSRHKDIALDMFTGQNIVGWNADAYLMIEFIRKKLKYDQRWVHNKLNQNKQKQTSFKWKN